MRVWERSRRERNINGDPPDMQPQIGMLLSFQPLLRDEGSSKNAPYPKLCKSHPNESYKCPAEEESRGLIAPDGNGMVPQQEAF